MSHYLTKKGLALVIVLTLSIIGAGCANNMIGGATEMDFQRPQEEQLPEEVQSWLNKNIQEYGKKTFTYEEELYILAAYGEKSSAGYSVEIYKIEKQDGRIIAYPRFQDPDPKGAVATVITYPYDLVVLENQGLPVEFKK